MLRLKDNGYYQYKNTKKFKCFIDKDNKEVKYIEKSTELANYEILRQIAEVASDNENLLGIKAFYRNKTDQNKLNYLVELKDSKTLEEVIEMKIKLEQPEVDSIIFQIANGLLALHEQNILHRDVKPANIIINKDNTVQLIDYDISRIYTAEKDIDTTHSGTHGFISPEQYINKRTDIRSDIYSFGKTIEILVNNCYENNFEYNQIILKATAMDARERFNNVNEIIEIIAQNKNRFFPPQIEQINKGKQLGLSDKEINIYAKNTYNARQMGLIKHSIHEKVDEEVLKIICDRDFTSNQMWQIKAGHQNGLTLSQIKRYAKPYYSVNEMTIYRIGLENNTNIQEIKNTIKEFNQIIDQNCFSDEQLKKVRFGLYDNLSIRQIKVYAHDFLSVEQMDNIIQILKEKV